MGDVVLENVEIALRTESWNKALDAGKEQAEAHKGLEEGHSIQREDKRQP